jgi:hypothetical protein
MAIPMPILIQDVCLPSSLRQDNAYERVPHIPGLPPDERNLSAVVYPSQASAYLRDDAAGLQLSLGLGRSHGVASFSNGSIDVFQHRRSIAKYPGKTGSIVLDDTERLFSQVWLTVGDVISSNRARVAMKLARSRPPALAFAPAGTAAPSPTAKAGPTIPVLPPEVHLQSVRASDANVSELVFRLQHLYALGEDPDHSFSQTIDPTAVLDKMLPVGTKPSGAPEAMTLDGTRPVRDLDARRHFPTSTLPAGGQATGEHVDSSNWQVHTMSSKVRTQGQASSPTSVQLHPMELATFRAGLIAV